MIKIFYIFIFVYVNISCYSQNLMLENNTFKIFADSTSNGNINCYTLKNQILHTQKIVILTNGVATPLFTVNIASDSTISLTIHYSIIVQGSNGREEAINTLRFSTVIYNGVVTSNLSGASGITLTYLNGVLTVKYTYTTTKTDPIITMRLTVFQRLGLTINF